MNKQDNPQPVQAWQEAVRQEVGKRPWLAPLLAQKGRYLFERFNLFYNRLRAAPRKLRRKLAYGVAAAALMLALSGAPTPVHAATITVGPDCTLVQAIISANTNAVASGSSCTAGSGPADTIVLPANSTHNFNTAAGTSAALPNITSPITIEANGATIQRTGGANMSLFRVNPSGNLTLNNATITGGNDTWGGGINNNGGTLTLNNSTVTGNHATNSGGGIYSYGGTTILNNSTVSGNTAGSFGGGIFTTNNYDSSGTTTLNNSTVTGNDALTGGGGIHNRTSYSYDGHNSTIIFNRTIVSGNTSSMGAEIDNLSGIVTFNNVNLLGHGGLTNAQAFSGIFSFGTAIRATSNGTTPTPLGNILNNTLANNGGPTRTHMLASGSPAIDAGGNCTPLTDQRGEARNDYACDLGAVEVRLADHATISKSVAAGHSYTFGPTLARVQVVNDGGCLTGISIQRINSDHPQAVAEPNIRLQTGVYWDITGVGCSSGFDVALTLPTPAFVPDASDKLCRYADGAWDCGEASENSPSSATMVDGSSINVIVREDVNAFSPWAAGDNVGPTAFTLQSITAINQQGGLAALMATLLTALSGIWLWARRPGQAQNEA